MNFYMLNNLITIMIIIIFIMMSVAFLTLFERKILSYIHYRKGPNKVSYWGMLQPFSDALKLLTKEFFLPMKSNYYLYMLSPMLMLILILMNWLMYPFYSNTINWNYNSLYFLCLMSMGVYGLIMSGWSSNSSFSMLGSIRSISQSISYEVTFSISFISTLMMIDSLNFYNLNFINKYMPLYIMFWPIMLIMMLSMLAEINRTPFDLSEGESELVSGFNIEYSNYGFVLIFLSEYASIMFMMFMFNILYLNSNLMKLSFYMNLFILLFLIIWIRTTLPRIRYDYLMYFCWIYLLPFILMIFMFYIIFIKYFINLNFLN